jgi:hypothetical protein
MKHRCNGLEGLSVAFCEGIQWADLVVRDREEKEPSKKAKAEKRSA